MMKIITLLLTILLFNMPAMSQLSELRITGVPKEEPSELVAKDIRDANGEVCAGVLVYSDLIGLTYQSSNGIVKVNHAAGKDFLFVSPDERMIEVLCSGYVPFKIILNEHGVRLKSGSTWSMQITGEKKLELLPVSFQIQPGDAVLWVDGVSRGAARTVQLSIGKHTFRVVKDGFKTEEKIIAVSSTNVLFAISLTEVEMSTVKVRSVPTGAQIFIDNMAKGETDKDLFLFPGEYGLKISKSGYVDAEKKIIVTETGPNLFAMSLIKNIGTLLLSISPSDAHVRINKEDYSNGSPIELAPGKYKIEVMKDGYIDQSESIDLARGATVSKQFSLIARSGNLQFTVQPVDAHIQLIRGNDVAYSWEGSKVQKGIPVGQYELVCTASGYRTLKKSITVPENGTVTEDIALQKGMDAKAGFVFIEGGTFSMGSDRTEYEKPIHSVTIDDFYLGKYEVTQREWRELMGNNPSYPKGDNLPVENVNWYDVQEFIKRKNQVEGVNVYRLPTEAEWEYAARGGISSQGFLYSGSNSIEDVAWYTSNSRSVVHEVGLKKPNELGIYDMSGNIWEWCSDYYDSKYYAVSPKKNPQGPKDGERKVLRGGSHSGGADYCRSTERSVYHPLQKLNYVGFRLVRTP